MSRCTRVWIEIEKPTGKEFTSDPVLYNAEAARRAALATKMLRRLDGCDSDSEHFWWSVHEHRYCFGGNAGYRSLADNGEWFNLEHFGRD